MTDAANHTVNGTSARADTRSRHHCWAPAFAEPSPSARLSGERMISLLTDGTRQNDADDPGDDRERRTHQHHRPTRRVDRAQLEAEARIPRQVPDAPAEVQEKGKRTSKQQDLADSGSYEDVHR